MKRFIIIFSFAFLFVFQPLVAQDMENSLSGIEALNPILAKKNAKMVQVDVTMNLTKMQNISRNLLMEVTPVLLSNNSDDEQKLTPFLIAGRTRYIMLHREMRAHSDHVYHQDLYQPLQLIKRENGEEQEIHYRAQIPFAPWMKDASFVLRAAKTGCADCPEGEEEVRLSSNALAPLYEAKYKYNFLVPEGELLKRREESFTANIHYLVGRYNIVPTLKNNQSELNNIDKRVQDILNDATISLEYLTMEGYASPEGAAAYNLRLSENRVNGFAQYLSKKFPSLKNRIRSSAKGQDWDGLKKRVEESSLEQKDALLRIITQVPVDERNMAIKKLDQGQTYQTLLKDFYPPLRRSEVTFTFVVKGFSLEEAKQALEKHPKRLSLAEVYAVAESYPKDSQDQYRTWLIAAEAFPQSEEPATNAAIMDIRQGRYQQAVELLEKYKSNTKLWGILGLAYAYNGQYEEAEKYLEKAAAQNQANAQHNLNELRHYLKDNF